MLVSSPARVIPSRGRSHVEQLRRAHLDLGPLAFELVGPVAEHGVELGPGRGHQVGWATQVPSKPSPASRRLSSVTLARAASVTSGLRRLGMNAAMPPMAWAPRRWQVLTSSSV